ncbi:MAG: hypothetical protein F6K62_03700 [Sphaerospermopsis sp. SIO1G2]|nr:hypothetical protein [Sphaerospermopsis sp. SIO1G1]NET70150.1 hypothetical protein [Sphaerospermopsis sp. SIO1G2]
MKFNRLLYLINLESVVIIKTRICFWLILLPSLYSNYSELNETIRRTHQGGVGRLLQEILKKDNLRYNLSVQQVIHGLLDGQTCADDVVLNVVIMGKK